MFKKKKKKEVIFEEEIVVATSKEEPKSEEKEVIEEVEKETETIQEVNIIDDEFEIEVPESEQLVVGKFTYYDNDPTTECAVDEDEIEITSLKEAKVNKEEKEDLEEDAKDKKELSSYFEKSKKDNKKIKEKPIKEKKKSRRQKNKETQFSNIKDQKVYIFRNKKYTKVEDFINYLNNHYLEIDVISQEVLDDERFYGWLSKKSGVFEDSINQFKEIKEKIEKK